jgi:alkanesulfonate monooxygenase SsuD/methylene tetrahydromethanopterin reductase-like flavin-dependent oxidoreductase (luciferase family)
VRVGLCLPVFQASAEPALAVARHAEAEGIDGVFSFDHLFPIGRPDRPALGALALLAAVSQETSTVHLGTLVTRVGMSPESVLVDALTTLDEQAPGRFVAGLGVGDRLSRAENDAYGIPLPPLVERMAMLRRLTRSLAARHVTTWIAGRSEAVRRVALEEADGWNCWEGDAAAFAGFPTREKQLSWAGLPTDDLVAHLRGLQDLGVAWAVYAPAPSIDWPAFVVKLAGAARAVR